MLRRFRCVQIFLKNYFTPGRRASPAGCCLLCAVLKEKIWKKMQLCACRINSWRGTIGRHVSSVQQDFQTFLRDSYCCCRAIHIICYEMQFIQRWVLFWEKSARLDLSAASPSQGEKIGNVKAPYLFTSLGTIPPMPIFCLRTSLNMS